MGMGGNIQRNSYTRRHVDTERVLRTTYPILYESQTCVEPLRSALYCLLSIVLSNCPQSQISSLQLLITNYHLSITPSQ